MIVKYKFSRLTIHKIYYFDTHYNWLLILKANLSADRTKIEFKNKLSCYYYYYFYNV